MTENPTHADGWVLKSPPRSRASPGPARRSSGASSNRAATRSPIMPTRPPAVQGHQAARNLRPARGLDAAQEPDPTAPDTALELVVKKHAFTLSFQSDFERDNFLRIWVNGVPASAVPKELLEQFQNGALAASLVGSADTPRGPTNGAPVSASATGAAVPPPPPPPASSQAKRGRGGESGDPAPIDQSR